MMWLSGFFNFVLAVADVGVNAEFFDIVARATVVNIVALQYCRCCFGGS